MSADLDPFVPAWWCRGPHAQTIWASALRSIPRVRLQRERWDTPDGDFVDADLVPAAEGRPILVILHGLEGSSGTLQVRGLLHAAQGLAWRALGLNFRSCSGEPNRLRRSYHGGDTADLRWVLYRIAAEHPGSAIACVGMSLGANVLLKCLGEGELPAALRAAAAVSAPCDLQASALAFERGSFNRIYMRRLLRSLKRKTFAKLAQHPDAVDRARLAAVRTIREFDELVTAPLHGFAGAAHYWSASSCRRFLASIRIPTLLINALDDPLIPPDPALQRELAQHRWITAAFPAHGGHVGFIAGAWPGRPALWAERQALRFLTRHLLPEPAAAPSAR